MNNTNYTLEQDGNNIRVLQDGGIVAHGFNDEESALQAVWVLEGKAHDDFYVVDKDGDIFRVDRGTL